MKRQQIQHLRRVAVKHDHLAMGKRLVSMHEIISCRNPSVQCMVSPFLLLKTAGTPGLCRWGWWPGTIQVLSLGHFSWYQAGASQLRSDVEYTKLMGVCVCLSLSLSLSFSLSSTSPIWMHACVYYVHIRICKKYYVCICVIYIYLINVGAWLVSWDPIVRNVCFLIEYLGVFFLGASIVSFFSQIHFF